MTDPDLCGHTSELNHKGRCRECLENLIDTYSEMRWQDRFERRTHDYLRRT